MIYEKIKHAVDTTLLLFSLFLLVGVFGTFSVLAYPFYKTRHLFRLIVLKRKDFSVFYDDTMIFGNPYIISSKYTTGSWRFTGSYKKCIN